MLTALLGSNIVGAQEPTKSNVRYTRKAKKASAKSDLLDTTFAAQKREFAEQRARAEAVGEGHDPFATRTGTSMSLEMLDKQIEMLKQLIKVTDPNDPEYPDYMFRLADHYLEKKAHYDLQVGALYEKIYDADQGPKADKKAAEALRSRQRGYQGKAKDAAEKATRVYAALVSDPAFANYKRMDEALYYYAHELGQLGRDQDMQDAYQRLLRDYSGSIYVPHAYLSFGDYYFEQGQIGNAIRLYEAVTKFEESPVYAFALYKLAWCNLNVIDGNEPRYDRSLDYFVQTIEASEAGRAGSDANAKQLRRDARRDLVRAYVHAAKPAKAWDFFQKIGNGPGKDEQDARAMMERLANEYFGDGQYTESTFIYEQLQAKYPKDGSVCEWQGKIVVNTLATDDKDVQWRETQALAAAFSAMADGNFKKTAMRRCRDNAHATLQQMATVWHDEAEKTHDVHTRELAANAYQTYLSTFPGGPDHYEMQYFYAELLWAQASELYGSQDRRQREQALEVFRRAQREFVKTLELDPEGKFTADAAFAQLLAMKNWVEYDETGGPVKACKTDARGQCVIVGRRGQQQAQPGKPSVEYPETDYTEDEKQMLEAYDVYTKYVKRADDPELPKIMYHRVKLMMAHNKFAEAEPLLSDLITKFDDVKDAQIYAVWSAAMLVDILTIRWQDSTLSAAQTLAYSDALEGWLTRLQGMKLWNHPEASRLRGAVPTLLAGVGWRKAMAHRDSNIAYLEGDKTGDPRGFEKCAATFIDVFNAFEDHDRADTLLWNAAECLDAAYQVGQAIQIRQALLERFPDSEHAKDTLHVLAESHQAVANYAESAQRYEEFAETYARDEKAPDALQNAYLFRLGLGQEDAAREDLGKYEGLYKKRDTAKAATIFWSQHDLLTSSAERRKHAVEYLDTYGTKGGIDRAVVAEAVIGQIDWRRSCDEPLLHDACITIARKKATNSTIALRDELKAKQAKSKAAIDDGERARFRPPRFCGSATQGVITVHRRSSKRSQAAQARFDKILKLVGKGDRIALPDDDPKRAKDFRDAWAMAMVYSADQRYESYLRVSMPEELDFVVEDWRRDTGVASWERRYAEQVKKRKDSVARFEAYLTKKNELGLELQERYAAVKGTQSPYWTLAAAARTASVLQNFADQLYRAEVPSNFKSQEQVWAYCDTLADYAEPVQAKALAAYEYCVERSTTYQFFNDYSRLCEEEMQQRNPDAYPATNELFGESVYTASEIDVVGVLEDPEGRRANPLERK